MDKDVINNASALLMRGKIMDGVKILKEEAEKYPDEEIIFYNLGLAMRMIGDFLSAEKYYKKAIKLKPEEFSNHYGIGIVYQKLGDYESAMESLQRAHNLNPESIDVINSGALTRKMMGDHEKALELYKTAEEKLATRALQKGLKQNKEQLEIEEQYPNVRIKEKDAISLMVSELKKEPLYCMVMYNMGTCLIEMGRFSEAEEAFKVSIDSTPEGFDYPLPKIALMTLHEVKKSQKIDVT